MTTLEQRQEAAQAALCGAFAGLAGAPEDPEALRAADEALWALDALYEEGEPGTASGG